MDPPNRVPDGRFSLCLHGKNGDGIFMPLRSRHGLLLIYQLARYQLLVWDPFNVDLHRLAVPPEFDRLEAPFKGAVFHAAGDIQHFRVVLVSTETDEKQHTRAFARIYSSETTKWGDRISTPLPSKLPTNSHMYFTMGVLVGHSLYWLFNDRSAKTLLLDGILEFDLEKQILAVKPVPVGIPKENMCRFQVMQAEGGGLGILFLSNFSAQLWKVETDCDGAASWVLGRTRGFAEYNNVLLLWTPTDLFMIQLEPLQFKKVSKTKKWVCYHLFESLYAAGNSICLYIVVV
ncbi:hypothetical protein VPH35_103093 [Triticum aestivum]